MLYLIGAVIIFIFVLAYFIARAHENTLLSGFWKADADFCQRAELEMFLLYLGDNIGTLSHCRNGYLLAANEQGIILNNPIKITFAGAHTISPTMSFCKDYSATIDWLEFEPEDPDTFPSEFRAAYYPKYGKLLLYKNDEVIASLWKDCHMSALSADDCLIPESCKDDIIPDLED